MSPSPDRMPTCLLDKILRSREEQAIWERLPEGSRRDVLVWIDELYFACGEVRPQTVAWFVNRRTDCDICINMPVSERDILRVVLTL